MSYQPIDTIIDFLEPLNIYELSGTDGFEETQIGKYIDIHENYFPDVQKADLVLVGCGEIRGSGKEPTDITAPDTIRKEFYSLYHWHKEVTVADVGNIKTGATFYDTYAALRTVVSELLQHNRRVVILGGSHDITLAQYDAYASLQKIIEATCVDACIDLNMESTLVSDNFLMAMLTGEPNFTRHYNHIGFQSYLVHPKMLEIIDKLGFDCYRVGKVKEIIEEMEPVIRTSELFSFDISAIQHSHAPANYFTPNGLSGEEACMLMQYAGMSPNASSIGVYGYLPEQDVQNLTAKQISHMLWYLIDGIQKGKQEAVLGDSENFSEYKLAFAEVETSFLQSKKTGRWWMQLPDGKYIACSQRDYITASQNEIPERWMRAVERS